MNKEENKNHNKKNITIPLSIGILIIIVFCFLLIDYEDNKTEYKSCVNSCVTDIDFCMVDYFVYDMVSDKYGKEFIPYIDYEDCFSELESCVNDCKRD